MIRIWNGTLTVPLHPCLVFEFEYFWRSKELLRLYNILNEEVLQHFLLMLILSGTDQIRVENVKP
jgi:hypothetical protein